VQQKPCACASWGATAPRPTAVPACVKNWMLLRIKALYDNRDRS
jgi:hypothetical protein